MRDTDSRTTPTLTVERGAALLPKRLRVTLAVLHPADDDVVALALATLPRGSRAALTAIGAIRTIDDADPPVVEVTPFGREVMAACALEGLPADVARTATQLDEELARRAASVERDPVEAQVGERVAAKKRVKA